MAWLLAGHAHRMLAQCSQSFRSSRHPARIVRRVTPILQRQRMAASGPHSLFGENNSSTSASASSSFASKSSQAFLTDPDHMRSNGMDLKVGPPSKPHPVSLRFALSRKPFFPIWTSNLRAHYKKKTRKRRGRGMSGRGGSTWRSKRGSRPNKRVWEGGTSPLYSRVPKWPEAAMRNKRKLLTPLSLAKIRYAIEKGRLDTRYPITMRHLSDARCLGKVRNGITLFNTNDYPFPYKINIEVMGADQSSIDMIKAVGGSVTIVYMNRIALRQHLRPYLYEVLPRTARPYPQMVSYLEKYKAKGALVRYIKPLWLIEEERRLQVQIQELRGDDGNSIVQRLAQEHEHRVY